MKSPMIQKIDPDNASRYTEMRVMQSPAGYYVGTSYNNPEGYLEPGTRDSSYFATSELAQEFLDMASQPSNSHLRFRMYP